jgi:hypothetical protein
MRIQHKGFKDFSKGSFGNGGDNLFVDANGVVRRIMDNDLNGNGIFDIVLPNSHGYIERAPTYIYTKKGDDWEKVELPHDSCWFPMAVDVDGDGYLDLIIANAENGVTSELQSYIYWGGPNGLTGERTAFDTIGAYDVDVFEKNGNGLKNIIFTTAWYDHHNPGEPMYQKVFVQTSPRQFVDATEEYKISGIATVSLLCEDLNNDGCPEIVLANYRNQYNYSIDSFIYWGSKDRFDTSNPTLLPTHYASQVLAADLNGDGYKELIFTGSVIPLPFLPDRLRRIFELLPFASMLNTPFLIYGGHIANTEALLSILLQIFWLTTFILIGKTLMEKAMRRVVVQGG